MVEKKESGIDRSYVIPLRREFLKVPKNRRAKKAITAIKEFLKRHMKSDEISIGPHLNKDIWKNGIQNPPHHVKVDVLKDNNNIVRVELSGFKIELPKEKEKKKESSSTLKDKVGKLIGDKKKSPTGKKEDKVEEKESPDEKSEEEEDLKEQRGNKKGKTEQDKILTKKGASVNY